MWQSQSQASSSLSYLGKRSRFAANLEEVAALQTVKGQAARTLSGFCETGRVPKVAVLGYLGYAGYLLEP